MKNKTVHYIPEASFVHMESLPEADSDGRYLLGMGNVFSFVIRWFVKSDGHAAYLVKKPDGIAFYPCEELDHL